MRCWDYLCHCPAVWVGEATVRLHGNWVQGSVYCRCTLLRYKNAVNWCIVTGLPSWLFMLCWFRFLLKCVYVCRHSHCPPTLLTYFLPKPTNNFVSLQHTNRKLKKLFCVLFVDICHVLLFLGILVTYSDNLHFFCIYFWIRCRLCRISVPSLEVL